jgi:hypothetical protein
LGLFLEIEGPAGIVYAKGKILANLLIKNLS